MNYKKLIVESWEYTQKNKSLIRWYGFFPAIFTTTVGIGFALYQFFSFKKSYLFSDHHESFFEEAAVFIWEFFTHHLDQSVLMITFVILFALFYLFYPVIAKASAIQMIARNRNGQPATVGTGLRYGIRAFLRLFEYDLLFKTFAFFSVLIEMSFALRNLEPSLFKVLLIPFIIYIFISLLLTLLFTFAEFFIVIDEDGVFDSMRKSAKLVISHWKHAFFITLLMILIGVRIIIQAVLVFVIPILIVLVMGYATTVVLPTATIILASILGGLGLLLAAYLNGIVDIFSYTVWTYTFLALSEEKEISAREVIAREAEKHEDKVENSKNGHSD